MTTPVLSVFIGRDLSWMGQDDPVDDAEDFTAAIRSYWAPERLEQTRTHLAEYYDERTPFTGSQFEVIADDGRPNEITEADLVAVSMLGVTIPADVAIWILSTDGRTQISGLLEQVPAEATIVDGGVHLAEASAMWQLWDLLDRACWPNTKRGNGMGQTKKSKLLAAKRPALVPVVDSVVRAAHPVEGDRYWAAFTATFDADTYAAAHAALGPRPAQVPVLRAVDLAIWQANRRRAI